VPHPLRFGLYTRRRGPPQKLQALGWVGKATRATFYNPHGHISQMHEGYFYGELVAVPRIHSHANNPGNNANKYNVSLLLAEYLCK
jgi:hypothetical protein